ncbi:MAG: methylmalonyl-CoA mutase [Candidatus Cloacimonetes bacterium HGW-Cloacimonetes-1]|nr:MAG: methylmalonyl-CoA mutase [Candidatus Cloacimonetes bacterium HGW-Cloacimonetes-1]
MEHDEKPKLNLLDEFPIPTWEQWQKAVIDTLKGVEYEKAMTTKTYEGITLKPIYRKEDTENLPHLNSLPGNAPYVRGNRKEGYLTEAWKIAQLQDNPDIAELNKEILAELNRGLNAVNIQLHRSTLHGAKPTVSEQHTRGVALSCMEDLSILLKGIDLSAVPIFIKAKSAALPMMGLLNAYAKDTDVSLKDLHGCIGYDPIAEFAENGYVPYSWEQSWRMMSQLVFWTDMKAPKMRTICIDATVYEQSGASAVQEIAFALSTAIGYIKGLIDSGLSIEQIAPRFQLNLSLGSNFFMEMAKIRAARLAWAEMIKAFGGGESIQKVWIHAETSKFNKSMYDPYVNVLRTCTEGFSGIIGGIDSLDLGTFDELHNKRNEFSKRIARNQQIILQEEAHFDRVVDPVGGCFYVETLTAEIAKNAWELMQAVETNGGMLKALNNGFVHSEIKKVASERILNADRRKDVYVGVNMFANTDETNISNNAINTDWFTKSVERWQQSNNKKGLDESLTYIAEHRDNDFIIDMITDAWIHHADIEQITNAMGIDRTKTIACQKLEMHRAVEHIEALRTAVEKHSKTNPLSVFMLNMGPISQHKARADFASAFMQVAGLRIINNLGYEDTQTAIQAALNSGAQAVCLCSTDDTYPVLVPEICSQLRGKGVAIVLAGYPVDMVETYIQAGIDVFIHLKANNYDTMLDLCKRIGVRL